MSENKFEDISYKDLCSEKTLQSNSKGFFLSFADFVAKEVGEVWIKNNFGKLKNDNERLKYVYESDQVKDLTLNFLTNVQEVYRPKNADFSQKKRLEAERFLKDNQYQKALMLFCQSILRAPRTGNNTKLDSGLSLSLALWGRAQALIGLTRYTEALSDIQQALKENLPGSYKAQAFWKMGVCYKGLNEENRANVSFSLAEKLLSNEKEQVRKLNEDRQKEFVSEPIRQNNAHPQLSTKSKPNLPNASGKLSVKSNKEVGRYMVANETISTGETLVIETPYVACLFPEMFGVHCQHCFKTLESPLGCPDCSSVAFCSVECKDKAIATYHKYECKYLDLLIGSGMSILAHCALRMITQNGLETSLDIYESRDHPVYKICTNSDFRPPGDFLQRTLMAAFLLRCLQKSGFFPVSNNDRVIPTEEEYKIGEMLLFNLQILQFNAHEIYIAKYNPNSSVRESKIVHIGVGLYLTSSMFNHNCYPSLARHFVGKDIVLTALRSINANEEVTENYGPIFTRKSLPERQRSLSSRYWFQCKCIACIQNWPGISAGLEAVSKRLRCPTKNCPQTYTLPLVKESLDCSKCKQSINLTNKILRLYWCEEQYQRAFQQMDSHQIEKAMKTLKTTIEEFYRTALPPHKETHLAEEMFRMCLVHLATFVKPK